MATSQIELLQHVADCQQVGCHRLAVVAAALLLAGWDKSSELLLCHLLDYEADDGDYLEVNGLDEAKEFYFRLPLKVLSGPMRSRLPKHMARGRLKQKDLLQLDPDAGEWADELSRWIEERFSEEELAAAMTEVLHPEWEACLPT